MYAFTASPLIKGLSFAQALGDWYFGRGASPVQLIDSCYYVQCNPGCLVVPSLNKAQHHMTSEGEKEALEKYLGIKL